MDINMEIIKKLREVSGAGMVDCKNALAETGGDIDKAMELLRKKGIAKAAKRTDRDTSEGVIKMKVSGGAKAGFMVEVNAETDFVARNEKFLDFADKILMLIESEKPDDLEALLALNMGNNTVKDNLDSLSGVIGEKLEISHVGMVESQGTVAAYSHMNGRIGVLVALSQPGQDELAKDMAMQIAAANPKYINPEDVDPDELEKEKEIYRGQLLKEGKPENMIDKIMTGKLAKYFEDVCLVKQEYIKDDKQKVEQVLGDVKVEKFLRFSL